MIRNLLDGQLNLLLVQNFESENKKKNDQMKPNKTKKKNITKKNGRNVILYERTYAFE